MPGIYLALIAGTLAVFSGVVRHEFINYDDGEMVYDNPRVSGGLTHDGLRFALTGPHGSNWHPLTTLSHQIDCQLFGVKPENAGWHHLVNLLLHVASVLLLFEALRRTTGDVWPSVLVAALFGVHPLRVESVAWVAERKDVLSGCFWMLTLLAYVRYARRPDALRYLVVGLVFCLGLMSKPMLVTLPCVLLLLDWWPLRRWRPGGLAACQQEHGPGFPEQTASRLILEKLPLLAAAAVVAGVTVFVQSDMGATQSRASLAIPWRLITAAVAYVFYLWKTIWPTGLAVLYPHPGMDPSSDFGPWLAPALGSALLLVAITGCVLYFARRHSYLLVGWLWYLGTLVPVIGLVQVGGQAYADRYTYLPLIGVYLAVSWGGRDLVRRWRRTKYPLTLLATAWLLSLMAVTWHQVGYWRDSQTLFEHTLQVAPNNPVIQSNWGHALQGLGRVDEALAHYQEAVRINPNYAEARNNWGSALQSLGRVDEALAQYQEALRIKPNYPEAHFNWGNALRGLARLDEAMAHYQEALRIDPNLAEAHNNWGNALQGLGRVDEALAHYQEALRIKPKYAEAHNNWGNALQGLGRVNEALAQYQEALRINAHYADAHNNWGYALDRLGRVDEAVAHYREALRLKPDLTLARDNLRRAEALLQQR